MAAENPLPTTVDGRILLLVTAALVASLAVYVVSLTGGWRQPPAEAESDETRTPELLEHH